MQVINLGSIGIGEAAETKETIAQQLAGMTTDEPLYVDIHSQGGSVFEGFAIYNLFAEWAGRKVARIKAAAFSIASYIAMAFDEIEIVDNGFLMLHNPFTATEGDDDAHAKSAELLSELKEAMITAYAKRSGMGSAMIEELMKNETYIGAERAVELGFADRITEAINPAAFTADLTMPHRIYAAMFTGVRGGEKPEPQEIPMAQKQTSPASIKEIKQRFPKASNDFVVKCMEEELDMEEVQEEHAKAMEEELEEAKAKLKAQEEEMEALKKAQEEEEPAQEKEPAATVGVAPVATVGPKSSTLTAREEWDALVLQCSGGKRATVRGAAIANKRNKQLRVLAVQEANPGQEIKLR